MILKMCFGKFLPTMFYGKLAMSTPSDDHCGLTEALRLLVGKAYLKGMLVKHARREHLLLL